MFEFIYRAAKKMKCFNSTQTVDIRLNLLEVHLAGSIGLIRQEESLRKGLKDKHGCDGSDGFSIHIQGAAGEMVLAKYLQIYWMGSVNTFTKINDVANFEVKTRSKDSYQLLVRRDNKDSDIFVLVVGTIPNFKIIGWLSGQEAKQEKWLKFHGDREGAYFVPNEELKSPSLLKGLIKND